MPKNNIYELVFDQDPTKLLVSANGQTKKLQEWITILEQQVIQQVADTTIIDLENVAGGL